MSPEQRRSANAYALGNVEGAVIRRVSVGAHEVKLQLDDGATIAISPFSFVDKTAGIAVYRFTGRTR